MIKPVQCLIFTPWGLGHHATCLQLSHCVWWEIKTKEWFKYRLLNVILVRQLCTIVTPHSLYCHSVVVSLQTNSPKNFTLTWWKDLCDPVILWALLSESIAPGWVSQGKLVSKDEADEEWFKDPPPTTTTPGARPGTRASQGLEMGLQSCQGKRSQVGGGILASPQLSAALLEFPFFEQEGCFHTRASP